MKPLLLICFVTYVMGWELSVLHVNDIHARMEETSKYSTPCKEKDQKRGKCFGGLARIAKVVKKLKSEEENVVWLNAGDFFQGTIWYSKFKWVPVAQFNNLLEFDAMTLGNHEFDNGMDGILPFLKHITCPIVVSNIDHESVEPEFNQLVETSIILNIGGKKIGLVGYLTPETVFSSNPPKDMKFLDEVETISKEVEKLTSAGINIIIALGHSGYAKDKEIAEQVPDVDIVVGAHTHTFLLDKEHKNPSNNEIEGPYPTVVKNSKGQNVLVVQAFAFTKYLGQIKVNFTEAGEVNNWEGMPILLNSNIGKDEAITAALRPWKEKLQEETKKIVGETKVFLVKSRALETNLGNLLTDAMVFAYRHKRNVEGHKFKMALMNSGGIRSSVSIGKIRMENIMTVFPFESTIDTMSLLGKHIREALEHGVKDFSEDGKNKEGGFFQISGLKVQYDLSRDPGFRLLKVKTICKECKEEIYEDLNDEETYEIITTSYIAGGGDGMTSIANNKKNYEIGELDTDVFHDYLAAHPVVEPEVEGRISLMLEGTQEDPSLSYPMFDFLMQYWQHLVNYF